MRVCSHVLMAPLTLAAVLGCRPDESVATPARYDAPRDVRSAAPVVYRITKLGTLAGGFNRGAGILSRGWVVGYTDVAAGLRHAALWRNDSLLDLESLGGPMRNSAVQWRGVNRHGLVVGISETATRDTLGGSWSCFAFIPSSGQTCVGFIWQNGVMTALPTLGGDNGFAAGVNNRGQVVGWAETATIDSTCDAPQRLGFRAVLWEPAGGTKRELRPLPGDQASAATAINDRGQAVGISGECDQTVGRFSAKRAVFWDANGNPTELPNLGGEAWHTPMAINERGDVAGFGNPPGVRDGALAPNGFLWTRQGGLTRIFPLAGDVISQARGINGRRQVVGVSAGTGGSRAFLYDAGTLWDLNQLVESGFPDRLLSAQDITDGGVITGALLETSTGKTLAYIATPK